MKRLRNVIIATCMLIGIAFLFAQHHEKLPEAYRFRIPYVRPWNNDNSTAVAGDQPADGSEGWFLDTLRPEPQEPATEAPTHNLGAAPPEHVPPPVDAGPGVPPDEPASPVEQDAPVWQPEFLFQQDLDLDLPVQTFQDYSTYKPHNHPPSGSQTYAYATFMSTHNPSIKDPYYMAIHSLIYRLLWSPRSRTQEYPFIVFVADFVTPEQRKLLAGAGAIVRELSPLEWSPNVSGVQSRWKDLFAKLNMWNETDFSRILFLDADAFPVANIDSMFDLAPLQQCIAANVEPDDYLPDGSPVCEPYAFAGVPQSPLNETDVNINVGSMVFTPSARMHQRLLQNYVKTDRYNCLMAEQAFLNWQFNIHSAFPSTGLEREWGAFFPQDDEEGRVRVIHEKLWSAEKAWLREEWDHEWSEMLLYYASDEFRQLRQGDGLLFG